MEMPNNFWDFAARRDTNPHCGMGWAKWIVGFVVPIWSGFEWTEPSELLLFL